MLDALKGFCMSFFLTVLMILFLAPAANANLQGWTGTTDLGLFTGVKCSTGLTCTRDNNKLKIVSSPTISTGTLTISGAEAGDAILNLWADEGDDAADKFSFTSTATDTLLLKNSTTQILGFSSAGVITYADSETLTDASDVITFTFDDAAAEVRLKGFEASDSKLVLQADESDDSGDDWELKSSTANVFSISNDTTGSQVAKMSIDTTGNVTGPGTGSMTGYLNKLVAATATTIVASQCGGTFYNSGAVAINLPEASAVLGCTLTFVTLNAANFDINPDDADTIMVLTNAAGDSIRNATLGNTVVLRALSASQWAQISAVGTWSDIN